MKQRSKDAVVHSMMCSGESELVEEAIVLPHGQAVVRTVCTECKRHDVPATTRTDDAA